MKVFSTNYRFADGKKQLNGCSLFLNRAEIDFILNAMKNNPKCVNPVTESVRDNFGNLLILIDDERKS